MSDNNENTNLKDTELEKVAGGNFNDRIYCKNEEDVKFRYEVGQHVEVFLSDFVHWHTDGGTVIKRYSKIWRPSDTPLYYAAYDVKFDKSGNIHEGFNENDIER